MADSKKRLLFIFIILLVVLGILIGRGLTRKESSTLTPEQKAEQERWLKMTPEEKEAEVRKEMKERGIPPERIDELMRMDKKMEKDIQGEKK
ncbi:MAG: hypothetical protein PHI44_04700 [Candidatus Ratteibacteria bacterium]|nr:hypothetical protein [Candidatus Ratteibacteria bacterium]